MVGVFRVLVLSGFLLVGVWWSAAFFVGDGWGDCRRGFGCCYLYKGRFWDLGYDFEGFANDGFGCRRGFFESIGIWGFSLVAIPKVWPV